MIIMEQTMKYIFWDIDGTLLKTGLAGVDAVRDAIKLRFGIENFQFSHMLGGATDSHIFKQVIRDIKGSCNAADAAGLMILYHRLLPQYLPTHQGSLMPNVQKTLQYFADHETGYKTCLLTGNTMMGAFTKLRHYGIDQYFDNRYSACGELSEDRCELARTAWQRLYLLDPAVTPDDIIIIGDTPNDIRCAQAIKARSLIVLAGSTHSEAELAACRPWRLIDKLPDDPQELVALLDEN